MSGARAKPKRSRPTRKQIRYVRFLRARCGAHVDAALPRTGKAASEEIDHWLAVDPTKPEFFKDLRHAEIERSVRQRLEEPKGT